MQCRNCGARTASGFSESDAIERWNMSKKKTQGNLLMLFSPADKKEAPYPSNAEQWRRYHGHVAWLYNPWSGVARDPKDIGSDPFGYLIPQ